MSKTIETTVYTYDELPSEDAKTKARDWYREGGFNYDWWDYTYSEFDNIAGKLGVTVTDKEFSGFGSQGDGARFAGTWDASETGQSFAKAIAEYAPEDECLNNLAVTLDALQAAYDNRLHCIIRFDGHRYSHDGMTTFDIYKRGEDGGEEDVSDETFEAVKDAMRGLMKWFYRQLEKEWDAINSDEEVADTIKGNEYTFTAGGKRFG